jgi:HK97 family phage portal protein
MMMPYITPEGGDIFYRHSDNVLEELSALESSQWFPQRDVLHIRLFTPRHPLIGESPITAALFPAAAGLEINRHTAAFFHNMSRPSGILRHPKTLSQEAMQRLKQRFAELVTGPNTGEPIVLQEDMSWSPMQMTSVDSELISSARLSMDQIAQVFRIPPYLLGELEKATFQNVESLTRFFISSSLGWYVSHFEENFDKFFRLPRNESIQFDLETAILRADLKERMDAYAKGIQSGVLAPNEARQRESLPPVKDGDEPRVQQQLVPLSYGVDLQPKGMEPGPASEPKPDAEDKPEPSEEQQAAAAFVARKAIEKAMEVA